MFLLITGVPRRGGEEESEGKRDQCAMTLKHQVDSIIKMNPKSNILIMGDFNDEPSDSSIHDVLGAQAPGQPAKLINLMGVLDQQGKGTYYFKGVYNMLDNLIVSKNLTTKTSGFRLFENTGYIFNPDFICFTNKNGDKSPSRTYGGKKYYGGFSDHFSCFHGVLSEIVLSTMDFKLVSPFKPTGDQPQAIAQLVRGFERRSTLPDSSGCYWFG